MQNLEIIIKNNMSYNININMMIYILTKNHIHMSYNVNIDTNYNIYDEERKNIELIIGINMN